MLYILMERRTLVKSGASSFTVAIPIAWVRRNALEKGSEIAIEENELGNLVLRVPQSGDRPFLPQAQCTIKVDKDTRDLLYWELVRAYLHNYTTINLEGDSVAHDSAQTIQRLNSFIGLDVIEQTKKFIVLKNFSAYDTESSPYSLLKKLDVGVRAMISGFEPFFARGFNQDDVLEMQSQHQYNARVYLFTLKLLNAIVDTPSLMRVFTTDYRQIIREHAMVGALHQISIHLSEIGEILLAVEHTRKQGKFIKEIFGELSKKYRAVFTMPKSPMSKELLEFLRDSDEMASQWQSRLKELRSPTLMEFVVHAISVNSILDQLALEIIN